MAVENPGGGNASGGATRQWTPATLREQAAPSLREQAAASRAAKGTVFDRIQSTRHTLIGAHRQLELAAKRASGPKRTAERKAIKGRIAAIQGRMNRVGEFRQAAQKKAKAARLRVAR